MSFLVEENAHETLQEALAFIDACVDTSSNSGSSSTSSPLSLYDDLEAFLLERDDRPAVRPSAFTSETLLMGSSAKQKQQQQTKRNTKTPQSHLAAVKRNREKKKAETTLLREQVAQLEAKLKQLKLAKKVESSSLQVHLQRIQKRCSGGGDGDGEERGVFATGAGKQEYINPEDNDDELLVATVQPTSQVSLWQGMAAMQARERHKSQTLNAELKDAVSKQVKLVQSLEALLLNTKSSQFGLDLLRDDQRQFLYNHSVLNQEPAILTDLRYRVEQMYQEFGVFFSHPSWDDIANSVVFSSQLKVMPDGRPVMEMRMNAPLRCSFREAGDTVWRRALETKELVQMSHYYLKRETLSKLSYMKVCTILLEGPDGSPMELNGTTYVQRFIGADHDAYMWASAIRLSTGGEVFREKGWMVASSSSQSNCTNGYRTVSRGFCQIFCDSLGDVDTAKHSAAARDRRAFVLKILGNRTRAYHEFTQNLLLNEFSGFQMRQPLLLLSGSESC